MHNKGDSDSRLSAASCPMYLITCFQINVDPEAQLSWIFSSTLQSSMAPCCVVLPTETLRLSRRNTCLLSLLILCPPLEFPSVLRFNSKASSPMMSPVSFLPGMILSSIPSKSFCNVSVLLYYTTGVLVSSLWLCFICLGNIHGTHWSSRNFSKNKRVKILRLISQRSLDT